MTEILTTPLPAGTTTPAGGTPRAWAITLPAGLPLLNANQRLHHRPKGVITKTLREAGKLASQEAGVPALGRVHVYGILCPASRRKLDPGNWYPSFKAAVDGALVDAKVLVDDDDEHLVGPDPRLGPVVKGGQIRLIVIEIPPGRSSGTMTIEQRLDQLRNEGVGR